jgi:four helix bundle protein
MKENLIKEKSFQFALQIINLYQQLQLEKEFIISKQLLKSGTSIGANVSESESAQSKADFKHKLAIAAKEARETKYWLSLLQKSTLTKISVDNYLIDIETIIRILTSIIKTLASN